MSFNERFNSRWENVISPAIKSISLNYVPLEPIRVDARYISDAILTEILDGIGNSKLIFGDITSLGEHDGRVVRNENVLYEIGLAHAMRLPEETVLFRSDRDRLSFDVQGIR